MQFSNNRAPATIFGLFIFRPYKGLYLPVFPGILPGQDAKLMFSSCKVDVLRNANLEGVPRFVNSSKQAAVSFPGRLRMFVCGGPVVPLGRSPVSRSLYLGFRVAAVKSNKWRS